MIEFRRINSVEGLQLNKDDHLTIHYLEGFALIAINGEMVCRKRRKDLDEKGLNISFKEGKK